MQGRLQFGHESGRSTIHQSESHGTKSSAKRLARGSKNEETSFFLAVKVFQSPSFNLSTFFGKAAASGQRRRRRRRRRRRHRRRRRRRQVSGDICCMPIFLLLLGGEKKIDKIFCRTNHFFDLE